MGGRPAKLNEKKGDIDLEQERKNKGDIFLLEEQHENFVTAVTKWEMLAATNASPLSITWFYFLFEQTINIIESFAFSPR